ncbi:MAG: hypothetical protein ACOYYS_18750 [Chloroflexota bacterium]
MERLLAGGLAEHLEAPRTLALGDDALQDDEDAGDNDEHEDEAGMVAPEDPAGKGLPPIAIPKMAFAPPTPPDASTKPRAPVYYADRTAVDLGNAAEVDAYDAWARANPGGKPASRQSLRDWFGQQRKQAAGSQA